MKKGNDHLIIGAVLAGGVVYYLWNKRHTQAQQQIADLPILLPVPATNAMYPATQPPTGIAVPLMPTPPLKATIVNELIAPAPPAVTPFAQKLGPLQTALLKSPLFRMSGIPSAPSQMTPPTVSQMKMAILTNWVPATKCPPIIENIVKGLTPAEITGLYNIFTTQWETGLPACPSHTGFWNDLIKKYPALSTGGDGYIYPVAS